MTHQLIEVIWIKVELNLYIYFKTKSLIINFLFKMQIYIL